MSKHINVFVAEDSAQNVIVRTSMSYEMQPVAKITVNEDIRA
jgi:hypothetical protein